MLKLEGPKKLFDENGKRAGISLPLFYKISVDYLQRLRKEDNGLFQQAIMKNKINRAGLKEIFPVVRSTYQSWKKELVRAGEPEKDWEKAFFQQAEAAHKKLGL